MFIIIKPLVSIIGLVAGVCTTIAFIPQVIRTIKTRETKGISLATYIIYVTGVFLWLIYGLLVNDIPLILANGVGFILAGIVLILKLKYG